MLLRMALSLWPAPAISVSSRMGKNAIEIEGVGRSKDGRGRAKRGGAATCVFDWQAEQAPRGRAKATNATECDRKEFSPMCGRWPMGRRKGRLMYLRRAYHPTWHHDVGEHVKPTYAYPPLSHPLCRYSIHTRSKESVRIGQVMLRGAMACEGAGSVI